MFGILSAFSIVSAFGIVSVACIVSVFSIVSVFGLISVFVIDSVFYIFQWKLGSWTYSADHVKLKESPVFDISLLDTGNKRWTVSDKKAVLHAVKYPCCPETYEHVMFTLLVTMPEDN